MTEADIEAVLRRAAVPQLALGGSGFKQHPGWPAFLDLMRDRQYGPMAALDAWLWFADGWDAAGHKHG